MVTLAAVLADLTSFQIIGSADALALVSASDGGGQAKGLDDNDELARVADFMKLQSEQKDHDDLFKKRSAVYQVVEKLAMKLSGSSF